MLRHPITRRRGTSLIEVLCGLGILALGAISVMVLFPFSALTLGQALQDDRTTTCAIMWDGQMRDIHRNVVEQGEGTSELYFPKLDNPGNGLPPVSRTSTEPSYPVYVDPMGWVAGRRDVGDNGETLIPRTSLQFIGNNSALALKACSLMDSLTYNEDGAVPGGFDMREIRYNSACMLQRMINRDRFTIRMQVVVYKQRAHLYKPPGSEAVYGATFTPGDTAITNVPITADIRKGGWVMDATLGNTQDPFDNVVRPLRHAEFYRVLSVTEVGNTLSLEVHKPIVRADGLLNAADTTRFRYNGVLVSMPGVADVFDRPVLSASAP